MAGTLATLGPSRQTSPRLLRWGGAVGQGGRRRSVYGAARRLRRPHPYGSLVFVGVGRLGRPALGRACGRLRPTRHVRSSVQRPKERPGSRLSSGLCPRGNRGPLGPHVADLCVGLLLAACGGGEGEARGDARAWRANTVNKRTHALWRLGVWVLRPGGRSWRAIVRRQPTFLLQGPAVNAVPEPTSPRHLRRIPPLIRSRRVNAAESRRASACPSRFG